MWGVNKFFAIGIFIVGRVKPADGSSKLHGFEYVGMTLLFSRAMAASSIVVEARNGRANHKISNRIYPGNVETGEAAMALL